MNRRIRKITFAIAGIGFAVNFAASTAFGQEPTEPVAGWKLVKESTEKVYSQPEFTDLESRHTELFTGIDGKTILWADVSVKKYVWVGASACPPGDARLTTVKKQYSFCADAGGNGTTACTATGMPMPAAIDPCS